MNTQDGLHHQTEPQEVDIKATISNIEKEIQRLSLKEKKERRKAANEDLRERLDDIHGMLSDNKKHSRRRSKSQSRKRSKSRSKSRGRQPRGKEHHEKSSRKRSKSRGRRREVEYHDHERRPSTSTLTTASLSKQDDSYSSCFRPKRCSSPGDYGMDEPLAAHKSRRRRRPSNEATIPREVQLELNSAFPSELKVTPGTKEVTMYVTEQTIQDGMGDEGVYTGMISVRDQLPHGKGHMQYDKFRSYSGDWLRGDWHGRGEMVNSKSFNHKGNYRHNVKEGHGCCKFLDGRHFIGMFHNDMREGYGNLIFADGSYYQGNFHKGEFVGEGKAKFAGGGEYSGGYRRGKYHGKGKCTWSDGRVYIGEWRYGKTHGRGIEYRADGTIRHDGMFADDQPVRD